MAAPLIRHVFMKNCNFLMKNASNLFKISAVSPNTDINHIAIRSLFSEEILGLEIHKRVSIDVRDKYGQNKGEFIQKMEEYLASKTKNTVFTDDLKAIVSLADTDEEIDTAIKMMKKYASQNSLQFRQSVIGPIAMRMFYCLKKPELALQLFQDENMGDFFDQMSSYLVLMDMLFEHGMHHENLGVYDDIQTRFLGGVRFPKDCMTIAMCTALKLGTKESYEKMLEYLEKSKTNGTNIPVRGKVAAALFAIRMKNPDIVFPLLEGYDENKFMSILNVKAMALVLEGRLDEAIELVGSVRYKDVPHYLRGKQTGNILKDTMEMLEAAVGRVNKTELTHKFEIVKKDLKSHGHLNPSTVEEFLLQPIVRYKQGPNQQNANRPVRRRNILAME